MKLCNNSEKSKKEHTKFFESFDWYKVDMEVGMSIPLDYNTLKRISLW